MTSIFHLINNYQDQIIACVTITLGTVQAGVSSWAIHRAIQDEHFLIYILGHGMQKTTKDVKEVIANFSSLKEFLQYDLFEIVERVKIAFSIALVAGICEILVSLLLLCLMKRLEIRKLWFWTTILSFIGLVSSFVLVLSIMMLNILYFQVFLATTGVNFFSLFHLILSMLPEICCIKKSIEETVDAEAVASSTDSFNTALTSVPGTPSNSNNAAVQTDVNSPEVDLPLPPPPPIIFNN